MSQLTHPNSKKVTILRSESFIDSAQDEAVEFMSMSKKTIGSYWESKNSKAVGSGLTLDEQKVLLPEVIDIPADDRSFRKEIRKFYESIATRVPHGHGIELEIGLLKSNDEPLSADNLPILPMDYIRYRHALGHPHVAKNIKEAKSNSEFQYYVYDPTEVVKSVNKDVQLKDEAMTIYLRVKDNPDKVWQMLVMMGKDPREMADVEERLKELRTLCDKDFVRFTSVFNESNFEEKALLQGFIMAGIVKKFGNMYVDAETRETVGESEEAAVYFFKNNENADRIQLMKLRMQEQTKLPKKKKKPAPLPLGKL